MNEAATAPVSSRRKPAGALALASSVALAVVAVRAAAQAWVPARELSWARETGWIAFCTLLLSLSVTPLARIARRVRGTTPSGAAQLRRALGMTSAWLAIVHALLSVSGTLAGNYAAVWSWPHLRAGLTALVVLLLLLLTSFAPVITLLRVRFFRELHRLAYVAPLLALQHVLLAPFAPRSLALRLVLATCVLGLGRCL